MSLDLGTVAVLVVVSALAGLLIGILPAWRRIASSGHRLPIRLFLRGKGESLVGPSALLAEIRCEVCGERAACLERLKAGIASRASAQTSASTQPPPTVPAVCPL